MTMPNRRKNATFDTPNMSDAGDAPRACEYVLLIVRMALSTWAGQSATSLRHCLRICFFARPTTRSTTPLLR
jgi:hypothetical protein